MKNKKLSAREIIMLVFLVVLITGVAYYMGFYTPLQEELASVENQCYSIDAQIANASSKIASMDTMQAELDEIFARPENEITEIAPYDNKEVVLNQLNGILQRSEEYNLSFSDPAIQSNGTVRRNVSMSFRCADFDSAKSIIKDLNECQWRCLVSNLSISGQGDVMEGSVQVSATITFFESTKINKPVNEQ